MILLRLNGVPRVTIDNANHTLSATRGDGLMVHCFPCAGTTNTYLVTVGESTQCHEVGKEFALVEFVALLGVNDPDGNVYAAISERWI